MLQSDVDICTGASGRWQRKPHILNHGFLLLCHMEWMWYKKYNTNYLASC